MCVQSSVEQGILFDLLFNYGSYCSIYSAAVLALALGRIEHSAFERELSAEVESVSA